MTATPQVSIITPNLNYQRFLQKNLESIADQRGVAVEHLVFDPGSWDGSREMLQERAGAGLRIAFEADAGTADAVNKGLAQAQGEILAWLCADDFYASPDALARVQAAFAANPEADIVYGKANRVDAAGQLIEPGPFLHDPSAVLRHLNVREPFLQPAAFVRRSALDKIGGVDGAFGLAFDIEFWLRAASRGARFYALDAILACKRKHARSATQLLPNVRAMDAARAARAHLGKASEHWVARAVLADAPQRSGAVARTCAAVSRRLDRSVAAPDQIIVLGNGRSLAEFDFEQIRNCDAIGMNAAYRYWDQIGWYPRYYACLDTELGPSHKSAIERLISEADTLGIDAFLLRGTLIRELDQACQQSVRVIDFDELAREGWLAALPLTTGSHAALFAAMLGYRELILLGVDCNYVEVVEGAERREGTALEIVNAPRENPNYFFDDYQREGDRYNIPNPVPDFHVEAWRCIAPSLLVRDIRVWNANLASRVDAFPKRRFEHLSVGAL